MTISVQYVQPNAVVGVPDGDGIGVSTIRVGAVIGPTNQQVAVLKTRIGAVYGPTNTQIAITQARLGVVFGPVTSVRVPTVKVIS